MEKKNLTEKLFESFVASNQYHTDLLQKLVGGSRVIDLLLFAPEGYKNVSVLNSEEFSIPENTEVILDVTIFSHIPSFKISAKNPYKILAEMKNGSILNISFFAGNAGMWKSIFKENQNYTISCKIQKFKQEYFTSHPKILKQNQIKELKKSGLIMPRYPLTAGLTQTVVQGVIEKYLKFLEFFDEDWLNNNLMSFKEAIYNIHSPKNEENLEKARKRLSYDEFLAKNLAFLMANFRAEKVKSPEIILRENFLYQTSKVLPFDLTEDQINAVNQIFSLQGQNTQNTALLQGDVGSGKTVMAVLAAINAVFAGFQVAVMAPTFILASQTFEVFEKIASQFEISVIFFSGADKGKKRAEKLAKISSNQVKIIVGTHALFSPDVVFSNLGYVIIDEQHRFGINQRLELSAKSSGVKTLLMTATPIPRTLSMAIFGDIEIIYIKSKPKNRKEIITKLFSTKKLPEIFEAIKRKIAENQQIYWVVPFIDESEDEKMRTGMSIEKRAKSLRENFGENEFSVIHGKMKEEEIFEKMQEFKSGKTKIMLATTVIEVGVDVPNATVIVIESAQNFGLSTLHQLRGRVGRGDLQSYCFLLFDGESEVATARLKVVASSNDGFFIAEKDMENRGSGGVFSKMQSGFEGFKFINFQEDAEILKKAKRDAKIFFELDSELKKYHNLLKFYNYDLFINFFKV